MSNVVILFFATMIIFGLVVFSKVKAWPARLTLLGTVAFVGYLSSGLMAMMVAAVLVVGIVLNPWRRRTV